MCLKIVGHIDINSVNRASYHDYATPLRELRYLLRQKGLDSGQEAVIEDAITHVLRCAKCRDYKEAASFAQRRVEDFVPAVYRIIYGQVDDLLRNLNKAHPGKLSARELESFSPGWRVPSDLLSVEDVRHLRQLYVKINARFGELDAERDRKRSLEPRRRRSRSRAKKASS